MSDLQQWAQRDLQARYGIRTSIAAVRGPQEAYVTKVGTEKISMAGQPAVDMPVIWYALPDSFGQGPGFGPAAYQPVPGWTPTVGTPCVIVVVGNGIGRPYVISFPTATPS